MLNYYIYSWHRDAKGRPLRKKISELDFATMPDRWVARCLSRITRYNGQIEAPDLAMHSLMVSELVEQLFPECADKRQMVSYGLWHDVVEIFVGDTIRPIKDALKDSENKVLELENYLIEKIVGARIGCGVYGRDVEFVGHCDNIVRDIERGWQDIEDTSCVQSKKALVAKCGEGRVRDAVLYVTDIMFETPFSAIAWENKWKKLKK